MPYLMSTHFNEFLERITITGDMNKVAKGRKEKITELLGGSFNLLDIFPSGSLVRGTGLKGSSDLDMVAVLHYGQHVKGKTPSQLLESVREALSSYNAKIIKKNGQAVTLYFATWPNADVVPAVRIDGREGILHIPDANRETWIETQPSAHDAVMEQLPLRGRQLVRMVKCWNQAHSGYFQSYHIELVALNTPEVSERTDWKEDDWPWAISKFFERALLMTDASAPMSVGYSATDWVELRDRLKRAQSLAFEAWSAVYSHDDVKTAVGRLSILFGDKFPAYG